jgi:F-type H+-transporting ATPase subunit gamma
LNTNVLRLALQRMRELEQSQASSVRSPPIGNKGCGFCSALGGDIVSHVTGLGDAPRIARR